MPLYDGVDDNEVDSGSPLNVSLFTRLRDNPIAAMEGAAGAPRLRVRAAGESPTAGEVRRYYDPTRFAFSNTSPARQFAIIFGGSGGVVRIRLEIEGPSLSRAYAAVSVAGVSVWEVSREGNGFVTHTGDIAFEAGDMIELSVWVNSGSDGEVRNVEFLTNGEELFPVVAHGLSLASEWVMG